MAPVAQLVIGPAGSGKSTYCNNIYQHCQSIGRTVHIMNLDPAADEFAYPVSADIRELISLADVMEEMNLGPNGALLYCMEYLEDSLEDWLSEALEGYGEDDCVIFDCPGQIELYSHHSAFRSFVDQMHAWGWRMVAVYLLDSQFITDGAKFIAGCMQCQAAMMNLELPHVNVMSKVDLMEDKSLLEPYLTPDHRDLAGELHAAMRPRYHKLNNAISRLLDDYSMVSFHPLDISDEDSLAYVLYTVDSAVQYGEDADVRTSR
eukprot:CAMPEP_0197592256 /NCGR_PEP_ID=MMETSP1326-20131121/14995_1 /TAXON_ID=1155430 /ORGANISM="Genus nov. species nov., Strain RCC2288" /LENGTH=261 /DNA_ID=CAMNT_0043157939 /DNA_START=48 /DNA_END=830 /DNA_ORIENTATION=+